MRSSTPTTGNQYQDALNHRILTAVEERDLAQRIEAGLMAQHLLTTTNATIATRVTVGKLDVTVEELEWIARDGTEARNLFTLANLRLASATARPFRYRYPTPDDATQAAHEGLLKAVARFDYRRGIKFSTFAMWWIRESLLAGLPHSELVTLPDRLYHDMVKVRMARSVLRDRYDRAPTVRELAAETGLDADVIEHTLAHERPVSSLDVPWNDDGLTLGDMLTDENDGDDFDHVEALVNRTQFTQHVETVLQDFDESDRLVITGLFGLDGRPERHVNALTKEPRQSRLTINQRRDRALAALANDTVLQEWFTYQVS